MAHFIEGEKENQEKSSKKEHFMGSRAQDSTMAKWRLERAFTKSRGRG